MTREAPYGLLPSSRSNMPGHFSKNGKLLLEVMRQIVYLAIVLPLRAKYSSFRIRMQMALMLA